MVRLCGRMALVLAAMAIVHVAHAQDSSQFPTYQRNRGGWSGGEMQHHHGSKQKHDPRHKQRGFGHHHGSAFAPPQVSGGYFQRPYPYHLDYYRMRWGGSYAPYFGNLYGPPNVVLGAPYDYGGYYGGYNYNSGPDPVPYEAPPVTEP